LISPDWTTPTKRGRSCGETKRCAEFPRRKRAKDGVDTLCRACKTKSVREWRAANHEAAQEYNRRYYADNREEKREYCRQYYVENRVKILERKRQYHVNNQDARQEYNRQYYKEKRAVILEGKRHYHATNPDIGHARSIRRRARKAAAGGTHTPSDIRTQLKRQKSRCYWCGKKVMDYHVDHVIPLSRGGSNGPENLVIACPSCNLSKGRKLPHEWNGGGGRMF